jgi:hypothetical protein
MYQARGFAVPGAPRSASAYLAQHDFVHVLADYGTTLEGELEVFALIGRADPDPRGFSWLATMVGLFETGYVHQQGFFEIDVEQHHLSPGMTGSPARSGRKHVAEHYGADLLPSTTVGAMARRRRAASHSPSEVTAEASPQARAWPTPADVGTLARSLVT